MTARTRRTDWALLVPPALALPTEAVLVLGGTDDMAQNLVDSGLAAAWRRPAAASDRCRLVVAWADATCSIEQIAAQTAPGGVMIIEIDRTEPHRRRLSSARVLRRLERVGSTVTSAHLVQPSFEQPTRYLPINDPRAVRWYLDTQFVASTLTMRVVRAIAKAVAASPIATRTFAAAAPRTLVMATAAAHGDAPSTATAQPVEARVVRPGERAIVLTSGHDAASRSVVLPFAHGDRSPSAVVKVASAPSTAAGTLGEHARLAELQTRLPVSLARSVPLPLPAMTTSIGRTVCTQTCATGPKMNASIGLWGRSGRRKRADLDLVVDWLASFGEATRVAASGERSAWMEVFDRSHPSAGPRGDVSSFLADAGTVALRTGLAAFSVQQHYDTGPWNIHICRGRPFLVDWETDSMRPEDSLGTPLADILYLVTYWYFQVRGIRVAEEESAALVRLFAEPTPRDADVVAARRAIDRALAASALERACVPAALAALWVERASYTERRRASLGDDVDGGENRAAQYLEALGGSPAEWWGDNGWWGAPVGSDDRRRTSRSPAAGRATGTLNGMIAVQL